MLCDELNVWLGVFWLLQEPINQLEKRALNFLVHEYLIHHDNKLTSITFSEENADQVWMELGCV